MKIINSFRNGLLLIALSAFAASAPAQSLDLPITANDNKLADADNGFAFDLLNKIAKEQPGQNIFISPFSAASALQMVVNGAAGQTKAEMQQVLNTTGIKPAELNADCKELNQALGAQTNVYCCSLVICEMTSAGPAA